MIICARISIVELYTIWIWNV